MKNILNITNLCWLKEGYFFYIDCSLACTKVCKSDFDFKVFTLQIIKRIGVSLSFEYLVGSTAEVEVQSL